jgi:hypothetical protein
LITHNCTKWVNGKIFIKYVQVSACIS